MSSTSTITAVEARCRFGELLGRVARGEEIVITRHDKSVVRIVPASQQNLAQVRLAIAGIRELRAKIQARTQGQARLTNPEVWSAIAESRR